MDKNGLMEKMSNLFGQYQKSEECVNASHCFECAEHNQTLLNSDRDIIGMNELGNPGWDPICFVNNEAFLYYFPALVRLAINPKDDDCYIDQFLFHITSNHNCIALNKEQCKFVEDVLDYLGENHQKQIKHWG